MLDEEHGRRRRKRVHVGDRHAPYRMADTAAHRRRRQTTPADGQEPQGLWARLVGFLPLVGKLMPADEEYDDSDADAVDDIAWREDDEAQEPNEVMEVEEEEVEERLGSDEESKEQEEEELVVRGVRDEEEKQEEVIQSNVEKKSSEAAGEEETEDVIAPIARNLHPSGAQKSPEEPDAVPTGKRGTTSQNGITVQDKGRSKELTARSKQSSPFQALEQKRKITMEEYERLSQQLRSLVEPSELDTPEQSSTSFGKRSREMKWRDSKVPKGPVTGTARLTKEPVSEYVPGAATLRNKAKELAYRNGDQEEAGSRPLPKRARVSESEPLYVGANEFGRRLLSRQERMERRPRPSRLLTGSKRPGSSKSTHSAAIAERIMQLLNKMESPLESEAKKPRPSTSLSWAKYRLSLAGEEQTSSNARSASPESQPPRSSLPKVPVAGNASASQASVTDDARVKQPVSMPSGSLSMTTPAVKTKAQSSITPLFSPPDISFTPAIPRPSQVPHTTQAGSPATPAVAAPTHKQYGNFKFTLSSQVRSDGQPEVDDKVKFFFSPPPALREPPKMKSNKAKNQISSGAAAFSFAPTSPKAPQVSIKTTSYDKPSEPKPVKSAPAKAPEKASSDSSTKSGYNPLARFMQAKPGSWKCPSCAVTNEPEQTKCPCCETSKPGGSASSNVAAEKKIESAPGSIGAGGSTFGGASSSATSVSAKETGPSSSVSSGGFTFGSGPSKSSSESNGFTFSAGSANSTDKPSTGFTFGASSNTTSTEKPGFTFGTPSNNEKEAPSTTTPNSGFAFSFSGSTDAKPPTNSSGGFSFGGASSATSDKANDGDDKKATTALSDSSIGFQFNSTSTSSKRKLGSDDQKGNSINGDVVAASSIDTTKASQGGAKPSTSQGLMVSSNTENDTSDGPATKKKAFSSSDSGPKFSFGSQSGDGASLNASTFGASSSNSFSFGAATKDNNSKAGPTASAKDVVSSAPFTFGSKSTSESAAKTSVVTKAQNDSSKTVESKPAFTFGSSSAPTSTESKPAFTFGASSVGTSADKVSKGGEKCPSAVGVSFSTSSSNKEPAKPAFAFGQTSTGTSQATTSTSSSKAAPFVFGASSGSSATPSTGFSFGSSTPSTSVNAPTTGSSPASSAFAASATDSKTSSAALNASSSTAVSQTPSSGSSTFVFGAKPSSTPTSSAPAFTFGANKPQETTSAATSAPAFTFGAGATAGSGFGSSATPAATSSASNATSNPFSSSSSFTSAFNPPQPNAPVPSFGASAATGATAFGGQASSVGFGGASTTQTTTGFGSQPGSTFGAASSTPAPAFGGTSAFGAGANPTPAPAFGASASSGFGASTNPFAGNGTAAPAFGAAATPAFGGAQQPAAGAGFAAPAAGTTFNQAAAPAPAFGSNPPLGGGGFGSATAPGQFGPGTGGGFQVGAAPKRRILKAKSRHKRS